MTIVDASSLIVLARLDGLALLTSVLEHVALTRDVETEVVTAGKAKGYRDAASVEEAVIAARLAVIDPTPRERRQATELFRNSAGLSVADCITIVCARERGHTLLIEDLRARRVATAEGVRCLILQTLPVYGYVWGKLSYAPAHEWTTRIARQMRSDPVVVDALALALGEIARLRGDMMEGWT